MSKKLKKFLNDAEKTESKIAELEEYLRNVRAAQKKEEDNEIVRAIRSTKLGGRDLLALLENIQAGNVTFQTTVNNENKTSEEAEMEDVIAKDDGYTGTNFNRPAFQKMIVDLKQGDIKVIMVKDLSRLGRDYIGVGDYIEQIFPLMGVRFIAVRRSWDVWSGIPVHLQVFWQMSAIVVMYWQERPLHRTF